MNRAFIFNGNNEDRSEYLTRMAQVIDSIRTGRVIPEVGDSYKNILTEDEQKELNDYVFGVMLPIIKEEGNFYIKKNGLREIADSYLNNRSLEAVP